MKKIQESASLFEVNVPDFKQLKQCRKELRMLKVRNVFSYLHHNLNATSKSILVYCQLLELQIVK